MEPQNTAFSESASQAILDMLVLNSAKISCLREELAVLFVTLLPHISAEVHQDLQARRLKEHYQRLKDALWANYGELRIDDLLNSDQ